MEELHPDGIVPGGDVGHQTDRVATHEHLLDPLDVPAHAGEETVDLHEALTVGLADLPHQQVSEKVPVALDLREAAGHPLAAYVDVELPPGVELSCGGAHRAASRFRLEHRQIRQDPSIHGRQHGLGVAGLAPGPLHQVQGTALPAEGLGRRRADAAPQGVPLRVGLDDCGGRPPEVALMNADPRPPGGRQTSRGAAAHAARSRQTLFEGSGIADQLRYLEVSRPRSSMSLVKTSRIASG